MFFLVVVYGCEILTLRKAEYQRIDAFEVWYWRRLLRVPLTVRRSNQSIQKEISPEYSLEGLMLSWSIITLATWCEELTHWKRPWWKKKKKRKKRPWCWKRLRQEEKWITENEMVGCHHRPDGHEFEQTLGDGNGQGSLACCSPWGCKESDTNEWLNWTDFCLNKCFVSPLLSHTYFH